MSELSVPAQVLQKSAQIKIKLAENCNKLKHIKPEEREAFDAKIDEIFNSMSFDDISKEAMNAEMKIAREAIHAEISRLLTIEVERTDNYVYPSTSTVKRNVFFI
jgi:hypothetical protein